MNSDTLARLRPSARSVFALERALAAIAEEREAATRRLDYAQGLRRQHLLTAHAHEIRKDDAAIAEAQLDLEQLDTMAEARRDELDAAKESAKRVRAVFDEQVMAAAALVQRFQKWVSTDYVKLAKAIAAGMELEREMHQAISLAKMTAQHSAEALSVALPETPRAFMSTAPGEYGTSFGGRVVLPATESAPPFWHVRPASSGSPYATSA